MQGTRLNRAEYPAGWTTPRHVHPKANVCIALAGAYTERWDGGEAHCEPTDLLLKPPGIEHDDTFGPQNLLCLNVELDDDIWEAFEDSCGPCAEPTMVRDLRLHHLGRRANLDLAGGTQLESLGSGREWSINLLIEFSMTHRRSQRVRMLPWHRRVRELLQDNVAHNPSLDELAQAVDVHPVYLAKRFRECFGCSVGEYRRQLRVHAAMTALAEGRRSLVDIATSLGFSDQSHFGRVFRRATGLSPGEWRARSSWRN